MNDRDTFPFPDLKFIGTGPSTVANHRKKPGIYYIVNKVNSHTYVGSSVDLYKRWNLHKSRLKIGKHHSIHLQRAWDKYGESNFEFVIIKTVDDKSMLISEEQIAIDIIQPEYNISPTAGNCLGVKHGKEFSRKMSEVTSGEKNGFWNRNHTKETRKLMSENHADVSGENNPMFGIKLNGEKNPMFGIQRSDTSEFNTRTKKGKTYEEMYGKEKAEELKRKSSERRSTIKQVIQKDLSGKIIDTYRSAQTAAKQLKIGTIASSSKKIRNCCLGKSKQALGFIWEYKKD